MRIAIDIDDTIFPTVKKFIKYHNHKYKTSKKFKDCKNLHAHKLFNLDFEIFLERWTAFTNTDYHNLMKPYPNSIEIIKELKKNNELYIITARNKRMVKSTKTLIENHFGKNFFKRIIHLDYKDLKRDEKHEICKRLNIKLIVDDSLETVLACSKEQINCILFNYRNTYNWNRYSKTNKFIKKASSWKDVEKKIIIE
ncbi:MAG: HAD hydrolase-like protein [archaeon]|nr:HAD hydrolase-like protein [archaeon]MDD2477626.1 HAD hydrolase-like protein [Candidatus ainarchaeum sp.]MDD3084279.1 HAD hydrolase-like protein [Candidatus ainarchaeum sp.]MDD4221020.1 HAD hydrolase-like protein [Candidatus ainarchaeum sp.]MDD4662492.1 HAD hydrolase-like protein [Candidatus ainarchaeum sp.]